ncbi:hypothetical protein AVDCRST_MAG84-5125 [uncultured Microcoleus sp.]|uniref:Tc1-like transposase DDE domain-containing protein n=1 Tax=uncultured Microcoleus sp. TaxID=259945 RepID=A0A6J4NGB7_9CYAN|nr:hypothetical protein AVDCRST_MAG84-5125 [uncultured Microcoleus sp.]
MNLAVWTQDEAGPFQTVPMPGQSWQQSGSGQCQEHQYVRNGAVKLLTLFCPSSGEVRAKGVTNCPNTVLHPWLKSELTKVLAGLPPSAATAVLEPDVNHQQWASWQDGLQIRITLAAELPPLRMLLVLDNLTGHKTPTFVLWLFANGIMPLYTPLSGSWLNMCESVQRIIKRRALECQHPQSTGEIIRLLEATVTGWNREPTAFEWGGKRAARRERSRQRRHSLGGSGAVAKRTMRNRRTLSEQWLSNCQMTH